MDTPKMRSYDDIQAAIATWQTLNFGPTPPWHTAIGVIEEVGEFYKANTREARRDALGDASVYSASLCTAMGWRYEDVVRKAMTQGGPFPHVAALTGDIAHAVLKRAQGIRGFQHDQVFGPHVRTALTGVTRMVLHWLRHSGGGLHLDLLREVATEVLKRDWVKNPTNAAEVAASNIDEFLANSPDVSGPVATGAKGGDQ